MTDEAYSDLARMRTLCLTNVRLALFNDFGNERPPLFLQAFGTPTSSLSGGRKGGSV